MMNKLHKADSKGYQFWEGWIANQDVIFHWGTVGETGERQVVSVTSEGEAEDVLQRETAAKEAQGFRLIDKEAMLGIVINYRLNSWGSEEDLETRHYLEDLCDQTLGWTGNGHCDGGDMGSGLMNVWCLVLDVPAAARTLSAELHSYGLAEGALIAKYDKPLNKYVVVWPDSQAGQVADV